MVAPLHPIGRPPVIVCEGRDDERFLINMLNHLGLSSIRVEYVEGESRFRPYIRNLRARPSFSDLRGLAIVRDADTDAAAKFRHTGVLLRELGYPVPLAPATVTKGRFPASESGQIGADGVTGIVVLPPAQSVGALEDLCLDAIAGDPSLPCVDQLLTCVASSAGIAWPEQYRSKARLNVWLGSRADPRHRLRDAISAGLFPMSHNAFGPIRQFLTDFASAASEPSLSGE
jgi:hypothetical protein